MIYNKIRNTKLIINIVVLILTYFFSFHIFPKLSFYNKLDFRGIEINNQIFIIKLTYDSNLPLNLLSYEKKLIHKEKDKFLNEYLYYLNKNKNLIFDAPCPKELMVNNLRNIQIYNDDFAYDFLGDKTKFNVRFSFYKFSRFSEKIDMNKCFDYIFRENLNKYFLLYRDELVKKIVNRTFIIKTLGKDYNPKLENSKETKNYIIFSTFLGEVEKGNIVSVDIKGNSIEGTFANGTKFRTYSPSYPNLVEKLSSKGVSFSAGPIENNTIDTISEKILKLIRSINYFVDPNVSYAAVQQNDKTSPKILVFIICLLIVVFINISFNKLKKKQISKFINKFINS